MAYKEICSLSFEKAVKAIADTKEVYCKHGVWNKYELTDTESAIKSIRNSGYGADVKYNEDNKMYYVSIPANCDMY